MENILFAKLCTLQSGTNFHHMQFAPKVE